MVVYHIDYSALNFLYLSLCISNALSFIFSSWLNNLQAEIGRFSHGNVRTDIGVKQAQKGNPSFSVFMATQGPPLTSEEIFSTVKPVDVDKDAYQL